jgi:hypothetical protein
MTLDNFPIASPCCAHWGVDRAPPQRKLRRRIAAGALAVVVSGCVDDFPDSDDDTTPDDVVAASGDSELPLDISPTFATGLPTVDIEFTGPLVSNGAEELPELPACGNESDGFQVLRGLHVVFDIGSPSERRPR